ncbi:NfeD family protein [Thiomicrospira sp. ALE5]|uniref:NfeD family protein n=1 Tax=Thiomicrospira sp. ALE5 TaxID=748650 RepID=UPI0008E4FEE4|nr:NfeD family protein [Thiomicrospira sp. ALE5]SFR52726.1 hypothetical protein SAMN03092900_0740 [Thiomicrospira sp. ALE5]
MITLGLLDLIPSWALIALGFALIGVEMLLGLFMLMWFGIGLIVVGLLSFVVDFEYGEIQLIFAFAIGSVLLFALRNKVIAKRNAKEEISVTYQTGGIGKLSLHNDTWMVFYHGTHWQVANPPAEWQEGQRVRVTKIELNQAWIEPE